MYTFFKQGLSKEEIIAEIRRCAKKLGHTPTVGELRRHTRITRDRVRRMCGGYRRALQEAGLQPLGPGYNATLQELFEDWAGVVRKLRKIPLRAAYPGKFSVFPLIRRFGGGWTKVPAGMQKHIEQNGLGREYEDVLETIAKYRTMQQQVPVSVQRWRPPIWKDRPFYGMPMAEGALACEPLSEAAVLVLFGSVARQLGFVIQRVQTQFPDCEALCEVEPGKCQLARIEFELASANFLEHEHDNSGCDLIVCWEHNWPECPLPVLELRTEVKRLAAEAARKRLTLRDDDEPERQLKSGHREIGSSGDRGKQNLTADDADNAN